MKGENLLLLKLLAKLPVTSAEPGCRKGLSELRSGLEKELHSYIQKGKKN